MNRWAVPRRRALAWLAVMLLVVGWAVPAAGQGDKAPAPAAPAADILRDSNGNKVTDNLEQRIDRAAAGERVPVIVQFDGDIAAARLEAAVGAFPAGRAFRFIGALAASLTPGQIRAAARQPFVVRVELNGQVRATNDRAGYWFGARPAGTDFGVDGDRDGNPTSYSAADLVVAVVDTGIDAGHADLDGGKVIGWYDAVGGSPAAFDDNGHGTHVAGTIAGTGDGNAAYRGVAPGAALVGVKVLDGSGSGTWDQVLAGIEWVIHNKAAYGIEVISLSLGGGTCADGSDSISLAIDAAVDAGIVAVVAAGNSGPGACTVGTPAAARKAITVGAAADPGEGGFHQAGFSSRGPTGDGRVKPDVSAPGVAIMSARASSGTGYVAYNGTSMATPYVSGVVALMLDADPSLAVGSSVNQVKDRIMATAIDWGAAGADSDYGAGMLDAYRAVESGAASSPARPVHQQLEGSLSGTGASQWYDLEITDTSVPIAAALIHKTGTGYSPDFDMYLYKPGSTSYVTRAYTYARQETISWHPDVAGTWRLQVKSYSGSGGYWLDTSAGTGAPPDQPPAVTVLSPAAGATVRGVASISAAVTDDVGVSSATWYASGGVERSGSMSGPIGDDVWNGSWDTTGDPDGGYDFTVVATDTAGQTGFRTMTLVVDNTAPLVTAGPTADPVGTTTAAIAWTTDENSDGRVTYRVQGSGGPDTTLSSTTLATAHSFDLAGLSAGTAYEYTVRSADAVGNAVTAAGTFTTAAGGGTGTWLSGDLEGGTFLADPSGKGTSSATKNYTYTPAPPGGAAPTQLTVTINVASYKDAGSQKVGDASPTVQVYAVEGSAAYLLGTATGAGSFSYASSDPAVLATVNPGAGSTIRLVVTSLNKSGRWKDSVSIDAVAVQVDYGF